MSNDIVAINQQAAPLDAAAVMERVLVAGDLAKLTPFERVDYYNALCGSLGLNPLTKPFEYITLNSKLTLYAKKDATEQLRRLYGVSLTIVAREVVEGVYTVLARATTRDGRTDESIGAVFVGDIKGEARANAMMKAETKAKRRVTLSFCGLGMLDETEVETIPNVAPFQEPAITISHMPPKPEESPDKRAEREMGNFRRNTESWKASEKGPRLISPLQKQQLIEEMIRVYGLYPNDAAPELHSLIKERYGVKLAELLYSDAAALLAEYREYANYGENIEEDQAAAAHVGPN